MPRLLLLDAKATTKFKRSVAEGLVGYLFTISCQ